MATKTLTMSPTDLLDYQEELVRTGRFLPLGRMRTIAIGPNADWEKKRPPYDPYIDGWGEQPQRNARGRMIDLTGQWLPIGQAGELILCTALLRRKDGYVGLPDLVDPTWHAPDFTTEEAENPDCDANCIKVWDIKDGVKVPHQHVNLRGDKDKPRMIPQRLRDRHDAEMGKHTLVFRPVLRITYQPEEIKAGERNFKPAEWKIEFRADANGHHCAFLVDENNGVCHFFGGIPVFGGDTRG